MKVLERALTQLDGLMEQARRDDELVALGCLIEASNIIWNQLKNAYTRHETRRDVSMRGEETPEGGTVAAVKN